MATKTITLTLTSKEFDVLAYSIIHARKAEVLAAYMKELNSSKDSSPQDILNALNDFDAILLLTRKSKV